MSDYDDDQPITFGKHKGTPVKLVPASYLLWLLDQGNLSGFDPQLYQYIFDNRKFLEEEVAEKDYE